MPKEEFKFAYKPRLMAPAHEFALSNDSLDWSIGPRSGRISFPMIRRIRLGYKPTNMANSRFIAEIWSMNAPKLLLQSVSAKNIIDINDHGAEYVRFLRELHRRVEASTPNCKFEAGFSSWRWWPSLIIGVLTGGALLYVVMKALLSGQFLVAGLIGGIGVWFLWQIWNIVVRNRPRSYPPAQIPDDVLPKN